jgi:hypothetical protein
MKKCAKCGKMHSGKCKMKDNKGYPVRVKGK